MPAYDHINDGVGRYSCPKCAANGNGFETNSVEINEAHGKTCDGSGRV
jgi:hypothetical protein